MQMYKKYFPIRLNIFSATIIHTNVINWDKVINRMICDYIMFLSTISIALILLRISDSYSVECQSQQKEHEGYIQKVS